MALLLGGCAASQHYDEGHRLASAGQPEQALQELRAALALEPNNAEYRLSVRNLQATMVADLLRTGEQQQQAGQFDAAQATYRRAEAVDPQSDAVRRHLAGLNAEQNARRFTTEAERLLAARRLPEAREKLGAALAESPQYTPALDLQSRVDAAAADEERARETRANSQSVMNKPISLQLRDANLRMVFETLSRVVGLNVILDRDVRTDLKTTIFVKDASVKDTVDLILLQNQLEKRVLNGSTLFIYPATPAKQKEYQELKVKTFALSNTDAKYVQGLLKSILKVKDVMVDEKSNTVVIRDTAEAVEVASALVASHDIPDPEVMLEVEVLEVSRDRLTNIGVKWPDSFGLATPPGTGPGGALTLREFRHLPSGNLLVQPAQLGVNINAQLIDSDANLLASPRIRVRHREKARILIGDRVPFVSGTNTIATGASPIVSNNVQYLDVGIKLEVEPNVYAEDDVGIRINMEVSNIAKEIANKNTGDTLYQIGTRSASTSLRLHDGETQVLAGLLNDQERTSAAKVPGLGQTPVLGRLFSNNSGDVTKTEIVLSITPHIIRGRPATAKRGNDIWSGTDAHLTPVPLRLDGGGTVRSFSTGGPSAAAAIPGARPQPQMIPGAVIPGVVQPKPPAGQGSSTAQPGADTAATEGTGPALITNATGTQPAGAQAARAEAPSPTPDAAEAPTQNIFSPPAPGYMAPPVPQPDPRAPGAGIRVQPFNQ
ncbi:secretin N-terminal domain-containing protein [Ramlibacter sp. MMS24-I3-19]|uniref:secretin N-terminal domain-containing protein n=1 Tax=Ramlibacter sp. MMS24-I3-19 TaxID=3416606 RepID=UPI003D00B9F0